MKPRDSKTLPSKWTMANRVLNGAPWSFHDYPFQKEIIDNLANRIIVQKGSQVGISEVATNRVFWTLDELQVNVLYVLPTVSDVSDFSRFRFDEAVESSAYLAQLFAGRNTARNVTHKRAGPVNLFCRGSRSKCRLQAIPVSFLVLDEYDRMVQDNIPLARERLTGSKMKLEWDISMPTLPGFGISDEYLRSDQRRWAVPCPACGHRQFLEFEANLVWLDDDFRSARFKCSKCEKHWANGQRLAAMRKGEWVVNNRNGDCPGYHVSQLYSPTLTAAEIVQELLGIGSDEAKKQVFWNSKLGLPYVAEGARVTPDVVESCLRSVPAVQKAKYTVMGVDVTPDGRHYAQIAQWANGHERIVNIERPTWEDLDRLMRQYGVIACVIDANPERTKSREFAERWRKNVFLAFYPEGLKELYTVKAKSLAIGNVNHVSIQRTEAIDRTIGRYKSGMITIPESLPWLREYIEHVCSPVKSYEKKGQTGQLVARYVDSGKPDHWLHAAVYCEIAHCIFPYSAGAFVSAVHPGAAIPGRR